jgi:hypothetical protein
MARRDGQLASAISIAEARADFTEFRSTALISGWLSTIEQLAKIGRVPEEERAHLRRKIAETVSYVNLEPNVSETRLIRVHRVVEARSRFVKAAIELQLAIANYDEAYGKAERCKDLAPQRIDKLLNDILSWRDSPCRLTLAAGYVGPHRGRPTSETTSSLWLFAVLLTANIENAGGRLTFDKNYPAGGTLVRHSSCFARTFHGSFLKSFRSERSLPCEEPRKKALRDACERSRKMKK